MRSFDASKHAEAETPFHVVADAVAELTREADRVVVIGAVARDLLASLAGGLPITRATKDVDIAICCQRSSGLRIGDRFAGADPIPPTDSGSGACPSTSSPSA